MPAFATSTASTPTFILAKRRPHHHGHNKHYEQRSIIKRYVLGRVLGVEMEPQPGKLAFNRRFFLI